MALRSPNDVVPSYDDHAPLSVGRSFAENPTHGYLESRSFRQKSVIVSLM
jgi:hypothetical protein